MQRQLCVKLVSKISGKTNSISPKSIFAPFYHHSTLPHCHIWKSYYSHNGVSAMIRNGFHSGSALSRISFANWRSKIPVNRTYKIHTRSFFRSFDSQYGGWRSNFRRLTTDGVVLGLIVTNVAVFLLWRIARPQFMVNNFMISVDNFTSGRIHTLITSAFSHTDMWHLISNMVGLYFFGTSIGRGFGPEYLLKLYLSGAIAGSIFYLAYHALIAPLFQSNQMLFTDHSKIPGLGASGAVNAIMLLDIFLFPSKTLYLDFIIPVPAILLGVFIIGKDILRLLEGDQQVSGSAHLGGATVAALAWAHSKRGRFRRF
ncbi:hypothetical protein ABFX02_04G143300 [Erythranthe guttata]